MGTRRRYRTIGCAVVVALASAIGAATVTSSPADTPSPAQPLTDRGDRFVPRPPGTKELLHFWYGPYTIPPGHDLNRIDLDLPVADGYIISVAPRLVRASDFTEPNLEDVHIHHAHWFGTLDGTGGMGDEADTDTFGLAAWTFGTGEEQTHADLQPRTDADPHGPIYGKYIQGSNPQLVIYMIHNMTAQPMTLYVILDVTFIHGTQAQLDALGRQQGRPYHALTGILYGRTFDVPRHANGRGVFTNAQDDPRGPIQWTSPVDGTIIGIGGHLHPGGINVITENYGSAAHPCPATSGGFGGTLLFRSDSIPAHPFSDDYAMTVTRPGWRAPIHKGDRIRISGTYENREHAWYAAMTYDGIYIDTHQAPAGRCAPYLIGSPPAATPTSTPRPTSAPATTTARHARRHRGRRSRRPGRHRRARARHRHPRTKARPAPLSATPLSPTLPSDYLTTGDTTRPPRLPLPWCGPQWGGPPCDHPEPVMGPGMTTTTVTIANFTYYPGDRSLPGPAGAPVQVKQGTSLTFYNADAAADIRHTVTTCPWPCNGPMMSNYPLADGVWDSGILSPGIDMIDGTKAKLSASTPPDLPAGKYSYYCRIHPWMRGTFEVVK